jgi:hypothetical protein
MNALTSLDNAGNNLNGILPEALRFRAEHENAWFTQDNIELACQNISQNFLNGAKLKTWLAHYGILNDAIQPTTQTIGIVMAGNLPLVGFQDWLCAWLCGYRVRIKLSEKDAVLLPVLVKWIEDQTNDHRTEFVEQLKGIDLVIATGSNNTMRYFHYYFDKMPNILRGHRSSVAVLTGKETPAQLLELAKDVFSFFGLGCRNISKIYLPVGYDIPHLLKTWEVYFPLLQHNKYINNYEYNLALYLLNRMPHFVGDAIVLREHSDFTSRIATLHYQYYSTPEEVVKELEANTEKIQAISALSGSLPTSLTYYPLGVAQCPTLFDYADNVDVMDFLLTHKFKSHES